MIKAWDEGLAFEDIWKADESQIIKVLNATLKDLDQWETLKNFKEQRDNSKISIPETFTYIEQSVGQTID